MGQALSGKQLQALGASPAWASFVSAKSQASKKHDEKGLDPGFCLFWCSLSSPPSSPPPPPPHSTEALLSLSMVWQMPAARLSMLSSGPERPGMGSLIQEKYPAGPHLPSRGWQGQPPPLTTPTLNCGGHPLSLAGGCNQPVPPKPGSTYPIRQALRKKREREGERN